MIDNVVAVFQLVLVMISLSLILFSLLKGDKNRTNYAVLLLNLCMLWMVLI